MARRRSYGDWDWYFPPAPPKLPAPEHGIRVRKFGSTWWGQRWIEALDRFGYYYSARLGRGRSYARQGRVHDLTVKDGMVTARVTGSRPTPYRVIIRLATLSKRVWDEAIKAMAGRAAFAASLLSGEMPKEIDEAFRVGRASLFPEQEKDLATECTCPDWANPCKHIAAVHYVLGEAFDQDPFLLLEFRGRSKTEVLEALRRLRASSGDVPSPSPGGSEDAPVAVTLAGVPQDRYDAFRGPVDGLHFHIETPVVEGALLRQLGVPPSWRLPETPRDLLQPAVSRAAALARELALGTAPNEAGASPEAPAQSSRSKPHSSARARVARPRHARRSRSGEET